MFLLVFRMNQCMARHCQGNSLSSLLFSTLEFWVQMYCTCIRGFHQESLAVTPGSEADDDMHSEQKAMAYLGIASKINCARLTIALGLACVAHLFILDAAAGNQGELEGDQLSHVMFLLVRLEGMLYPEELQLMDESICITKEWSSLPPQPPLDPPRSPKVRSRAAQWLRAASSYCEGDPEPIFRAEVNRHRLDATVTGERLIGQYSAHGESSVVPLPKIVLQLLLDSVLQAADQKWGYWQRYANWFTASASKLANTMEELSRLVSQPLPLAYMQHCRALLMLYAIVYPLSLSSTDGIFENIAMPLIIFSTLYGFEVLASEMENPLGMDEMDLNLLDMVHSLEVSVERAFNLSEESKVQSMRALRRPLEEFGMTSELQFSKLQGLSAGRFSEYFVWHPVPTLILAALASSHGHVDTVHQLRLHGSSVRRLLRRSIIRRRKHDGGLYHQLGQQDTEVIMDLRRDPMLWCHYLSLRRSSPDTVNDANRPWSSRMEVLLLGTPAAAIFAQESDDSSERTVPPETPKTPADRPPRRLLTGAA